MGFFFKKTTPTTIITDLANWPGINATQEQSINMATTEMQKSCMPAEWYPQRAVQITWPDKQTDWEPYITQATKCYLHIAYEISSSQPLIITCRHKRDVETLLKEKLPQRCIDNTTIVEVEINDTWVRDYGFITILENGKYKLLDFKFNGWGGKFEADKDNAINQTLHKKLFANIDYQDEMNFVFEGGSIESDGQGTLLTTSQCLLNPNRNPQMSKGDIQHFLLNKLKSRQLLWLDHGYLAGDDTDSHIDTLARLCPNDTIVYVKCYDSADEHYEELSKMEAQLKTFETLSGKPFRLMPLPMGPRQYDDDGMRLPTTYANYLVINKRILMPTYGDKKTDTQAAAVLQKAFPKHSVTGIDCRILVEQHGSLHCSTMQYYV